MAWSRRERASISITFIIALFCDPIAQYISVAPWGSALPLMLSQFVIVIGLLGSVILIPICIYLILRRRWRRNSFFLLVHSLIFFAAAIPLVRLGGQIRHAAFVRLAEASKPLVQAIHHYEEDKGEPPRRLDDLLPDYLSELPKTGMRAYPDYYLYIPSQFSWDDGNPWVLIVETGEGLSFDQFLYFPNQNYPERGYGGSLEKIGDWAYVHE